MTSDQFWRKRKVLVTGGAGFIGSNLVRSLIKLSSKLTIIDCLLKDSGGNLFNIKPLLPRIRFVKADVRKREVMEELIKDVDVVFHLAGVLSHVDSMKDPLTDLSINTAGSLSLLEAIRHHNPKAKVVFTGTRNQFGRPQYLPVDEDHPMEPIDANGVSSIAAEWYFRLYASVYDIPICVLRLTNTYGPRHQMRHPRQGVLNWFIRQVMNGEEIRMFGGGGQIRDAIYVDDLINALLRIGSSDSVWGNYYNIAGIPVSLRDFVKLCITVWGSGSFRAVPFPPQQKIIEPGDYIASGEKLRNAIHWKPTTKPRTGIRKTIAFYRKYQSHYL